MTKNNRVKASEFAISMFTWITKLCIGMGMGFIVLGWVLFFQGHWVQFTELELVYNTLYILPLLAMYRGRRLGMWGFVIMNLLNPLFMEWDLTHYQMLWVMFPGIYASHIIRWTLVTDLKMYRKRLGRKATSHEV